MHMSISKTNKLSFANSAMIAAHEISAAREPIGIAEKRL